jgi:hypothetical protein
LPPPAGTSQVGHTADTSAAPPARARRAHAWKGPAMTLAKPHAPFGAGACTFMPRYLESGEWRIPFSVESIHLHPPLPNKTAQQHTTHLPCDSPSTPAAAPQLPPPPHCCPQSQGPHQLPLLLAQARPAANRNHLLGQIDPGLLLPSCCCCCCCWWSMLR